MLNVLQAPKRSLPKSCSQTFEKNETLSIHLLGDPRKQHFKVWPYCPPYVDGIWGIWGSYYTIPKAIFYLLKGTKGSEADLRVAK